MSSLGELSRSEEVLLISASLNLMVRAIDMCNGPSRMGLPEFFLRKIVGELAFAAVVVASVVETVVRAILMIPGGVIFVADPEGISSDYKRMIAMGTVGGAAVSGLNICVAVTALFENLYRERLNYDDILPCVTSCVRGVRPFLERGAHMLQGRAF